MKNLIAFISIVVLGLTVSSSAEASTCIVDTTCTGQVTSVCPTLLAQATVGSPYTDNVTYYAVDQVTQLDLSQLNIPGVDTVNLPFPVPVILAEVANVANLPDGLTYNCGTCSIDPRVYSWGCLEISGTPCGFADTLILPITLNLTVDISAIAGLLPIPGIPDTVTVPFPQIVSLPLASNQVPLELDVVEGTNYLCPGGTLDLKANGGYADYNWSNGTQGAADSMVTINAAGTYSLTVTDANTCTQVDSVAIEDFGASVSNPATICNNQFTRLEATGGDSFTWSPAANLSDSTIANPTVYGLTTTTSYQLIVSNGLCNDTTTVTVTVDDSLCQRTCQTCDVNAFFCTAPAVGLSKVCPTNVGPVLRGAAYDTTFSFYLADTLTLQTIIDQLGLGGLAGGLPIPTNLGVAIDEVEIVGINGLPSGLSWETDQMGTGNVYYPNWFPPMSRKGCVSICGTTCETPGTYNASLQVAFTVTVPNGVPQVGGTQQQLPAISVNFNLDVAGTPLTITPSGSTDILAGDSVTLDAENAAFSSYTWSNGATTASITVTDPGTYTVTVTDDDGCDQSQSVSVTRAVGIEPIDMLTNSLSLYPNPTNGQFELSYSLTTTETVHVSVLDIQGRVVASSNFNDQLGDNQHRINLAGEAAGLYFVRIETSAGVVTRKLTLHR